MSDDALSVDNEAAAAAPPNDAATDAPESDQTKLFRDRMAQRGREYQQERLRAQQLEGQVQQLNQTVQQLTQRELQRQQQDLEAQIGALPADQQAIARAQLAERRVVEMEERRRQEEQIRAQQAYARQRAQELVAEANAHYGLDGDQAITVEDLATDEALPETLRRNAYQGQEQFLAALTVLAEKRRVGGGDSVAKKKAEATSDLDAVVQKRVEESLKKLGVSAPNAARAAGSPGGPSSREELNQAIATAQSHKQGTAGIKRKLQEAHERALAEARK